MCMQKKNMEKGEVKLGTEFYTATGKWRCTDIGTRVIVAIPLNQEDSRNYNAPPYSIPENVFDDYDLEGCSLDPIEFEDGKEKVVRMNLFKNIRVDSRDS